MPPMPTAWWLRPVRSDALVGEHSAVVWKRLNLRPLAASRWRFGVLHGQPVPRVELELGKRTVGHRSGLTPKRQLVGLAHGGAGCSGHDFGLEARELGVVDDALRLEVGQTGELIRRARSRSRCLLDVGA